jgi:hypothetical protein
MLLHRCFRRGGRTICAGNFYISCAFLHRFFFFVRTLILVRVFRCISFCFIPCVYHVALNQALLEPCEGELGCVLWDDAVRRAIPTPSCAGQHHIAGASFFALVSF